MDRRDHRRCGTCDAAAALSVILSVQVWWKSKAFIKNEITKVLLAQIKGND